MNGRDQSKDTPDGLERRRVQRLGASSLIITLPKKWANLLGIKVGDTVYLKLSKGHIKIIPSRYAGEQRPIIIRVGQDLPEDMARLSVSCLYILGIDEAVLDISRVENKEDIIFSVKGIAQELIGMDVVEMDGKLMLKVFIDKRKIDINTIISNYKNLLLFIINLIYKVLYEKKTIDRELEIVKRDLVRYQHLLLRFVKDSVSSPDLTENIACSVSSGTYLGMAIDALIGAAHMFNESLKRRTLTEPRLDYRLVLDKIRYIINIMINNIINPKPDEILQMREEAKRLFTELGEVLLREDTGRSDLVFASALLQFARIVNIYTNVVSCRFVETQISRTGEPWVFY